MLVGVRWTSTARITRLRDVGEVKAEEEEDEEDDEGGGDDDGGKAFWWDVCVYVSPLNPAVCRSGRVHLTQSGAEGQR